MYVHMCIYMYTYTYSGPLPKTQAPYLRSDPKCLKHPAGPGQKFMHLGAI